MASIRNYIDADFPQLENILKKCGVYSEKYDTRESIRKKMEHDTESVIVAEENGQIIGCVFIIYDPWSSFIYRLGIDPDYRRRGIGNVLMQEAERRLTKRGTNPITIFVHEDNIGALEFYRKRGWKPGQKVIDMEK